MKIFILILLIVIQQIACLQAEDSSNSPENLPLLVDHFSRREGYEIASTLKKESQWIDLSRVIEGIQDYMTSKETSNLVDRYGPASYCSIITNLFEQAAAANLQEADSFLRTLKNQPHLHSLENGKICYEVVTLGEGSACVQRASVPLLHYSVRTLNEGGIIDTRMEHPYRVALEQTIIGFAKGVEGMRVGERRTIYIHPDLGYGRVGYAAPNSLLIVDVEVISL